MKKKRKKYLEDPGNYCRGIFKKKIHIKSIRPNTHVLMCVCICEFYVICFSVILLYTLPYIIMFLILICRSNDKTDDVDKSEKKAREINGCRDEFIISSAGINIMRFCIKRVAKEKYCNCICNPRPYGVNYIFIHQNVGYT